MSFFGETVVTPGDGLTPAELTAVTKSLSDPNSLLKSWYDKSILCGNRIEEIQIKGLKMFGPKIGFWFIDTIFRDSKNRIVPGTVFLRGDSVASLIVIEEEPDGGSKRKREEGVKPTYHTVFVEELKAPAGCKIKQIPAGMLDGSNKLGGKMFDEIKEETGLELRPTEPVDCESVMPHMPLDTLISLGSFAPSIGGCEEIIHEFAYFTKMTSSQIAAINLSTRGRVDENENIIVHIVPLTWKTIFESGDSKAGIAAAKLNYYFPGYICS
jgi:ADP-sugar diphosphatase